METYRAFLLYSLVLMTPLLANACGGFSVKSIKVENCGKNNVIKVNDGATVQLLPNCDVVPNGCGETSGFKTASVKYTISKKGKLFMTDTIKDLCIEIQNHPDALSILTAVGLPNKCPIPKLKQCVNKKFNIDKYKGLLAFIQGKVDVKIETTHDTGTSCHTIALEIKK